MTYGEVEVIKNGDGTWTINVGIPDRAESDAQPAILHGVSICLAAATDYDVSFDFDLSTWDSYNEETEVGTGYWDSFSVGITDQAYPKLDLNDPLSFPFVWGGQLWGDGELDTNSGSQTFNESRDTEKVRFLNVVLDTITPPTADGIYPSWGTFTFTALPEPYKDVGAQLDEAAAVGWEGGTLDFLIRATPVHGTISSVEIDLDRDGVFDVSSNEYDPVIGGVLMMDVALLNLLGSPADDGEYPADVRIWTGDAIASDFEIVVAVGNLPPDATISDPQQIDPGQDFVLSVSTSDPGPDTITSLTVDWGDGISETFGVSSGTFTHTYTTEGTYEINVTVQDEDGTWTTSTHALVGVVDPPPTPPDTPYVASAYATEVDPSLGTMQLELTEIVPFDGSIESVLWDLDLDGVFGDASGTTVVLTAEPGDAWFADVQITDSGGFVGEAAFTFFFAGEVSVEATKNTYAKNFNAATPAKPAGWPIHHWYEQKSGLVERLRKAGINVHDTKHLRAVPPKVHTQITDIQRKWWAKIAKDEFGGSLTEAYKNVDLQKFRNWADELNGKYTRYFMKAGEGSGRPVQIIKNLRRIGGIEGLRLSKAHRMKQLGFAVGSIALFDLFAKNTQAGINIWKNPPAANAALEQMITNYEAAVDEATGTAGRVKHNTGDKLKDSLISYMTALGYARDSKVVTGIEATMGIWIDSHLEP